MRRFLQRAAKRLLRTPTTEDLDRLRVSRDEHRTRAQQWRARSEALSGRLAELVEQRDARIGELRRELGQRRRSTPKQSVLRYPLHARAGRLPLLSHDVAAAQAREERLLAASPAYRAAIEAPEKRAERLALVEAEGLRWWVPGDDRMPDRLPRATRQGLPLRAILQTRELAIGGLMIDLGANIGRTSIPRVILGDVRAVYGAEPDPDNYACLVQNVVEHGLRGLVLPDQVAIGAARGEVLLRRSKYIGGHRVLQPGVDPPAGDTVRVPCWTLDDWTAHLGIERQAVTFIKADVQGSEVAVLRGAAAMLAQRQIVWLMEVDPALLAEFGTSAAELLGLLQQHFTHFIDIGARTPGERVQRTSVLGEALGRLGTDEAKTDLLLFTGTDQH